MINLILYCVNPIIAFTSLNILWQKVRKVKGTNSFSQVYSHSLKQNNQIISNPQKISETFANIYELNSRVMQIMLNGF